MYEDSYLAPIRSITCLIHKREKSTHLCTDLQCVSNPVLCAVCFQESKHRSGHISHQSALKPINEAIQILADMIKKQIKPAQSVYERTLGHRDNELVRNNLEKVDYLTEEIENRIGSIKLQVDLEIQILTKEFQRQILLQKQEFIKKLDDYRRTFFSNLDTLKKESSEIMNFQNSLKFYNNPNTLLLKLSMQTEKRSLDWILQQKKTLNKITKNQTSSYMHSTSHSILSSLISRTNEMNMMVKPVWVGQKKQLQGEKQLKTWIKTHFDTWVSIPQLKDLSKSVSQHSPTHASSPVEYRSSNLFLLQNLPQFYQSPYNNIM